MTTPTISSHDIRATFIAFFKEKQHTFVPGCPVVPENDPTLLFINAGMNQFKDVFLDQGSRPYSRAVNSQCCIRVSGKHNDLEDVGKDTTHLTSFEMLGNWSFGDFYKKEAITWAWELLTRVFCIPKEKLVVSVFEDDNESEALWRDETDIDPRHIVRCDANDNFWEMGDTGPCGPCSEIHVHTATTPLTFPLTQADLNSTAFTELWNLVFIQYNRNKQGDLHPLPQQHVDTGAGLERVTAYLQQTTSTYQTDLFQPILKRIETLSGVPYVDDASCMPHRVMADHTRTLTIAIADGVRLSNEGRGYVLRRLLRRACRYAKQLGFTSPVLYKLVPEVLETLGHHFSHLNERKTLITDMIHAEEKSFLSTLNAGIVLFEQLARTLKEKNSTCITGLDAFTLYDTYGFPVDLTQVLAEEHGFTVDLESYFVHLNKQRSRSRSHRTPHATAPIPAASISPEIFKNCSLHLAADLGIAKGGEARVITDPTEKIAMARHHSATHLLHESLRRHLGSHVEQAGSLVDSDKLRFDFTHFEKISTSQLKTIEQTVSTFIAQDLPVTVTTTTLSQAKKEGVLALFGEKYDPNAVRLVAIGAESKELCAGTHVTQTAQLEAFVILSETAIAAGIRRIEALVGTERISSYFSDKISTLRQSLKEKCHAISTLLSADPRLFATHQTAFSVLSDQLHTYPDYSPDHCPKTQLSSLVALGTSVSALDKKLKKQQRSHDDTSHADKAAKLQRTIQHHTTGSPYIAAFVPNYSIAMLRSLSDALLTQDNTLVVLLASEQNNRSTLLIKYGTQVTLLSPAAHTIIKETTAQFGGGGGGRAVMAQAGGLPVSVLKDALAFACTQL